jgi:TIR domain
MLRRRADDGRIFISYRRSDVRGVAGRLDDSLSAYFGAHRVFRDIDDIEGGADFLETIQSGLASADAVIVLIGPGWLAAVGADGQRRLDQPDDVVAAEIAVAIERGIPVFPVLVENATMPQAADLPPGLQSLSRRNAITVTDARWEVDVARLAKSIAFDIPGSVAERKLGQAKVAILLMLFVAVSFTVARVSLNAHHLLSTVLGRSARPLTNPDETLLSAAAAGINSIAILGASILLLIVAPLMDSAGRRYARAGATVGIAGTLVCFVLYWRPWQGIEETIGVFAGSTIIAAAVLALAAMSGFTAK